MEDKELIISVIALIISILSLVASIIFAVLEIVENRRMNKNNIAYEFIKDTYQDYMVNKIPEAYRHLRFDANHKLLDTQQLQTVVLDLRKESRYFKFSDEKFFETLSSKIITLQDYLGNNENKIYEDIEDQFQYKERVKELINDIYECINTKLTKGKVK